MSLASVVLVSLLVLFFFIVLVVSRYQSLECYRCPWQQTHCDVCAGRNCSLLCDLYFKLTVVLVIILANFVVIICSVRRLSRVFFFFQCY